MYSPLIDKLIVALRRLPGVGPKSAQRMAFHLLEKDRRGAALLSECLQLAVENVAQCQRCRTLTEESICGICASEKRDASQLCIVETPADILALEQAASFRGKYFVLMGHLSPIDGIGPRELGIDVLEERFRESSLEEIIIATNPTIEGEATSHYIAEKAKSHQLKVTRIAHGVPIGGELEYIDGGTLLHAINSRREI